MTTFFDTLINVITPILLAIGLGVLYARRFRPDARVLSGMIIYLFAPFLVARGLASADLTGDELLQMGAFILIASVLMIPIGWGVARLLRLDHRRESALILSVILFNGANYGIPFNQFAFGEAGGELAIVYYSISVIIANTVGVYLAARGTTFSTRDALFNVFRIPLIYATVIGIALNLGGVGFPADGVACSGAGCGLQVPLPIARVTDLLADATIPAMLVLIGFQLARIRLRRDLLVPVAAASATTLVIMPLVGVVLALLFGLEGLIRDVGIVQLGMPTAVIASALATEFGGDGEFVTSTILVSTVCSVVTLSVLVVVL